MPMHTWMTELYGLIPPGTGAPGALGINTAFGDRCLHQITIPGTHDAGCYVNHDSLPSSYSQTQELTIGQQLDHGIRYFDIRPHRYWAVTQWAEEWWTYHGPAYYGDRIDGPTGILQQTAQFLHDRCNDQELVILNFSHFSRFDAARHRRFVELIEDFLWDFLVPHTQVGTPIRTTTYDNLLTGPVPARPMGRNPPPSLPVAPLGGYGAGPRSRVLVIYDGALDDSDPIAGLTVAPLAIPARPGFWVLDPKYPAVIPGGFAYPVGNEMRLFDQYADSHDLDTMRNDQLDKLRNRAGRAFTGRAWNPQISWDNNPSGGVPGTLHLFSWTLTPKLRGFPINYARGTSNPALSPLFTQGRSGPARWPLTEARSYDSQLDPMINIIYVDVSNSLQYTVAGQPWTGFDMPVALAMYLNRYVAAVPWDNWGNW